jgi:Ankyrin repeats (many copies)
MSSSNKRQADRDETDDEAKKKEKKVVDIADLLNFYEGDDILTDLENALAGDHTDLNAFDADNYRSSAMFSAVNAALLGSTEGECSADRILWLLLHHNNDVNAPTAPRGSTCLHLSVMIYEDCFCEGDEELTKDWFYFPIDMIGYLCKERHASLDIQDCEGKTALHHAVSCGANEIAQYLFTEGASVTIKDKYGNTPLSLAEENAELSAFFAERGNKASPPTVSSFKCLYRCIFDNLLDILRELLEAFEDKDIRFSDTGRYDAIAPSQNMLALALSLLPKEEDMETWRTAVSILFNRKKLLYSWNSPEDTYFEDSPFSAQNAYGEISIPSLSGEERAWVEPYLKELTPEMLQNFESYRAILDDKHDDPYDDNVDHIVKVKSYIVRINEAIKIL